MATNAVWHRATFIQHRVCTFTKASESQNCVPDCTSDTHVQFTTIHNNIWYHKECQSIDLNTLIVGKVWYLGGYSNWATSWTQIRVNFLQTDRQTRQWNFRSSEMRCCVTSNNCYASIQRQSVFLGCLALEMNHSPNNGVTSQKTSILSSTAVTISNNAHLLSPPLYPH